MNIIKHKYYFPWVVSFMLIFCNPDSWAQSIFQKTIGTEENDIGTGVLIQENGDLIIVTNTSFPDSNYPGETDDDVVFCRTNSNGEVITSTRLLMEDDQEAKTTISTQDGSFLIAGDTYQSNLRKCFLLKLNPDGIILWTKEFTWQYGMRFHFIREDEFGNMYLGLDCFSSNGIYPDDILLKMDADGNIIWKRTWGIGNNDHIFDIHFLNNGNLIIVFSIWFPDGDLVFICLDPFGQTLWQKSFFEDHNYYPRSFIELGNGECILVGRTSPSPVNTFAIKFDVDFNIVWKKHIISSQAEIMAGSGIRINDKIFFNAIIAGYNGGDIGLICMDINGNINWVKSYGGNQNDDYPPLSASCITGNENGIYLTGTTESFGQGGSDAYLIKTDLDGISGCNETELSFQTNDLQYNPRDVNIDLNFDIEVNTLIVQSTQTDEISLTVICAAEMDANFTSDTQIACAEDSINFFDLSEGNPTSWLWNFEGGIPPTSLDQNPENIYFPNSGTYDVTLVVSNNDLTDTIIRENYITIHPRPDINLGSDTLLCEGSQLLLNPGSGYNSYLWQDGSTNPAFNVITPGIYWVEVSNTFECSGYDTINVGFLPAPEVGLGTDTSFCNFDTIKLTAPSNYPFYLWQDGSTDSAFMASQSGTYWVEVTDENGCSGRDTINLTFLPSPNITFGNDTLICYNQLLTLEVGPGFDNILWQDGSQGQSFLVTEPGLYWVNVSNDCGLGGDTISVEFSEPFDISLGNDTSFCYGHTILLDAGEGFSDYVWDDGSQGRFNEISSHGFHWVLVSDSLGCTAADSVFVEVYNAFEISLGNDTTHICEGEYIFLNGPDGFESYLWQDGSDYPSILADSAGTYWLEVTDENGCAARDSVELIVNIIPENLLGNDTVICPGGEITIQATPGYSNYVWHDGSQNQSFTTNHEGIFWLTVQDDIGCAGTDTIKITDFEIPGLGMAEQEWLCPDDTLLLDAGGGYLSYLWSDGSQNQTLQVFNAGNYAVEVETVCGLFSDAVEIKLYSGNLDLGNDTILCDGEVLYLNPGNNYSNFHWSNGSSDSTLFVKNRGTYWLKAFDGFCIISDTIVVDACAEIWIPNVFTPNSDRYNDTFFAETENPAGIINFKMVIFNRWGRIVHTLENLNDEWDGKINGSTAAEGVYFWECNYSARDKTGKINFHSKQGSVTLMR